MLNRLVTFADWRKFKEELTAELSKLYQPRTAEGVQREYIRSNEACRMLQVSIGTLHNLRAKNILPFTKIGGVVYYKVEDIKYVLDKHKK
ncbi:helix-turn-helix domain-containing protein [Dawidia soli]|uniref:Helix-turn-helix domain-containing protein n=1 Tax=Dawidia soli TaxID=2782352 RepID=A0AAP2GE58_9BACT|nr:helix-turn-helix domain-containing protein [Dawidia soli]MBT1688039.1 helix-turn-helix domain-containing protein [Dawidia soli]